MDAMAEIAEWKSPFKQIMCGIGLGDPKSRCVTFTMAFLGANYALKLDKAAFDETGRVRDTRRFILPSLILGTFLGNVM